MTVSLEFNSSSMSLRVAFHDIIPAFTHLRKSSLAPAFSRPLSLTFLHVGTLLRSSSRRSCLSNFYTQTESCFLNLESRQQKAFEFSHQSVQSFGGSGDSSDSDDVFQSPLDYLDGVQRRRSTAHPSLQREEGHRILACTLNPLFAGYCSKNYTHDYIRS